MFAFHIHARISTCISGNGKDRTAEVFRCILVSLHDAEEYSIAEVRKAKGSPSDVLQKAENTYTAGLKFRMSEVEINTKAKPKYNNTPCKITVDLTKTKMAKLLQSGSPVTPTPSITCAECLEFNTVQAFDITALVDEVGTPREVSEQRRVRDVWFLDGSLAVKQSGEQKLTANQSTTSQ